MNNIVLTEDGSHTIFVPELNEHYHSVHGAVQESETIFIRNGYEFSDACPLHIFEVGFGTGLNALLTAVHSIKDNREVFYTSVDNYPLDEKITGSLNYPQFAGEDGKKIFEGIHAAKWGVMQNISGSFYLRKIRCDIKDIAIPGPFNLIFFDAFGPDKQPEIWSSDIFRMISGITAANGLLVTYSAKGDVKRNLRANGFTVTLLPGPPGKRQVIRAIKI